MVVTCVIDFDNNPHGTYFAGQTLTGHVTLQADEQKEVRGVMLKVNGFASTHWTESTTDNKSDSYSGHEDYIKSKTYLLGSSDGTSNIIIEPGTYNYNFACHIPVTCPSSFEGFHGHVRYEVKIVLVRPWKINESHSRCFTVLKILDLNNYRSLLSVPVHIEVEKSFSLWPFGSKPMKFKLSLPQTGFVPGQEIPVGVLVTNDSVVNIEEITIKLAMIVHYYCEISSRSRAQRMVMAKLKGEGVLCQCTKSFVYSLRVPATPPTCFDLCRFIKIAYQVELKAKIKGWHRNGYAHIPVSIGSVPLVDAKASMKQQSMKDDSELLKVPSADIAGDSSAKSDIELLKVPPGLAAGIAAAQVAVIAGDSSAPDGAQGSSTYPWAIDDSIPPPSYEQAMHLGHDKVKDDKNSKEPGSSQTEVPNYDELNFVPLYPVFDIPSPSALSPSSVSPFGTENDNVDKDKGTLL